jgi:hypothetical protein
MIAMPATPPTTPPTTVCCVGVKPGPPPPELDEVEVSEAPDEVGVESVANGAPGPKKAVEDDSVESELPPIPDGPPVDVVKLGRCVPDDLMLKLVVINVPLR